MSRKNILYLCFLMLPVLLTSQEIRVSTIADSPISEICTRLMKEIYSKAGLELDVISMTATRATFESTSGNTDGETHRILSYGKAHPELIAVPVSYYQADTVYFTQIDNPGRFEKSEYLHRYRFAILKGVKDALEITEDYPDVQQFEDSGTMLQFLHLKRADFGLLSRLNGLLMIKKLGFTDLVAYEPPVKVTLFYHYLNRKREDLVPLLEKTIKEMKESGELARLVRRIENEVMGE